MMPASNWRPRARRHKKEMERALGALNYQGPMIVRRIIRKNGRGGRAHSSESYKIPNLIQPKLGGTSPLFRRY